MCGTSGNKHKHTNCRALLAIATVRLGGDAKRSSTLSRGKGQKALVGIIAPSQSHGSQKCPRRFSYSTSSNSIRSGHVGGYKTKGLLQWFHHSRLWCAKLVHPGGVTKSAEQEQTMDGVNKPLSSSVSCKYELVRESRDTDRPN